MGLFSKRRTLDYQGFAKYTDEYNRHAQSSAAQDLQRAQSLSNASHAAMAALQKHQTQKASAPTSGGPVRGRPVQNRTPVRANSLGGSAGGYLRANSLQSYTYTPKASYVTGPAGQKQLQRTQSLRTNSLAGGRRAFSAQPVFPEEDEYNNVEDGYDEENVVVTTKTTKVLDAQGRTRSITTETVRQLADGSNIIETKTTNILRQGSRANSLRANSLQGAAAAHAHSHAHSHAYSLKKIEEDLLDFEYNYLDHAPPRSVRAPEPVYEEPEPPLLEKEPLVKPVALSPVRAEYRANSLTSTQSPRKLKSILKSSSSAANAAAVVAASENGGSAGAAKNGYDESSATESSDESSKRHSHVRHSSLKLQPAPNLGPSHRHGSLTSAGNSIKFLETVETIPYTYSDHHNYTEIAHDEKHKKEQALQNNVDLYTKALQVATEKVYGSPRVAGAQFEPAAVAEPQNFAEKKSEKKLKTDEKLSKTEASGVSKNYVYTNHHKDFSIRSLRDRDAEHHSSRKERAKEEKRQIKEEEKEHAERLRAAEKQMKEEEREKAERLKAVEKQKKQEDKDAKRREKTPFSLFKRNKRHGSISGSSLGSSERKQSVSNDPVVSSTNYDAAPVAQKVTRPIANRFSKDLHFSSHEEVPGTPNVTSNDGKMSKNINPQQAISFPSSNSEQAHIVPDVKSPIESAPQSESKKKDFPQQSKNVQVAKELEDELQLSRSQTFDDDDDEFVDVPDNIGDDVEKRISSIPILAHGSEAKYANPVAESSLERPPTVNGHSITGSKSADSIKIPQRGDLDRQPPTSLPANVPETKKHAYEPFATEELPTLVSGSNGTPEVMSRRDHYVFQPRDVNEVNHEPLDHHAFGKESESEFKNGKASKFANGFDNKKSLEYSTRETLPGPSAEVAVVTRPPHGASKLPNQDGTDYHQSFINNGSDSLVNVEQPYHVNPGAQNGQYIPSGNTPVEMEGNPQDLEVKSKAKKKTSRFKKVIEKYFITPSYSR